ncbi:MAG: hypothetical protein WC586_00045 [Methanoregula sp.]
MVILSFFRKAGSCRSRETEMETGKGTIQAARLDQVPVGAAIALVLATPVMNKDPGWPFLAAVILAAGFLIPIIICRQRSE